MRDEGCVVAISINVHPIVDMGMNPDDATL